MQAFSSDLPLLTILPAHAHFPQVVIPGEVLAALVSGSAL